MADARFDYDRILNTLRASYAQEFDQITLHRDMIGYVFVVVNGAKKYVLKVYRPMNSAQAIQAIDVIRYLEANNYPVVAIVPTVEGRFYINVDMTEGDCVAVLFDYINGAEPKINSELQKVGQLTGKLHAIMEGYPGVLVSHGKEFFIDRFIKILQELNYPASRIADLSLYGKALWGTIYLLPKGFCHGDLHSGNILVTGSGDYVLFDFDVASTTTSIVDLATLCDQTDFNVFSVDAYDRISETIQQFAIGYRVERDITDVELNAVYDFLAIRHYELIATIVECQGLNCVSTGFLDQQYHWLMSWKALCASKITSF